MNLEKSYNKRYTILKYVSLAVENYDTFFSSYIKILLQVGSEIVIVDKSFSNYHEKSLKVGKTYSINKEYDKFIQKDRIQVPLSGSRLFALSWGNLRT